MASLNLKHLRYFWAVAVNGSIVRASQILHLTPQTISGQLRELEEQVGGKLFAKAGRNLVAHRHRAAGFLLRRRDVSARG